MDADIETAEVKDVCDSSGFLLFLLGLRLVWFIKEHQRETLLLNIARQVTHYIFLVKHNILVS